MPLPYSQNTLKNAILLRKNATKQEKHLWYDFLNKYPVRFQRQKAIGIYIADFYCSRAKLIVEIDGLQHYTTGATEHEKERSEYLNSLGLNVIRFKNSEINNDFHSVCNKIDYAVKNLLPKN